MKKIVLIAYAAGGAVIIILIGIFTSNINKMNLRVKDATQTIQQMQSEVSRLKGEKDKLSKESDKLQTDSVLYVNLNNELQAEKGKLQKEIEEAKKTIENKETEIDKARKVIIKMGQKNAVNEAEEIKKIRQEKEDLIKKMEKMQTDLQKERALYNYNLGVAYSQSGLYDEAVSAYKKSLENNPSNPDAHYNLGVLFADVKNDPDAAIEQYQEYLQLKPDASDKEEVEALIEKLK